MYVCRYHVYVIDFNIHELHPASVAYEVRVTTFPDGSAVIINGSNNILEFPVGSSLFLVCAIIPTPPANSQFIAGAVRAVALLI